MRLRPCVTKVAARQSVFGEHRKEGSTSLWVERAKAVGQNEIWTSGWTLGSSSFPKQPLINLDHCQRIKLAVHEQPATIQLVFFLLKITTHHSVPAVHGFATILHSQVRITKGRAEHPKNRFDGCASLESTATSSIVVSVCEFVCMTCFG